MKGKTVVVTGATNGIGEITALELARKGAQVVIISRSEEKCRRTVERIRRETDNHQVDYLVADLSLMAEVRAVAEAFLAKYDRLDVLVNNAGAYFNERRVTSEANEKTLALNHLSYFLLTHILLDRLQATAQDAGEARIINVSSDAHRFSPLNLDDLQREKKYSAFGVYAESKLMNVMFTYELARRLKDTGVTVNAVHPGFVRTGFGKDNNSIMDLIFGFMQFFALSPERGAETSIYLASSPEVQGVSGKYFSKSRPARSSAASYIEGEWRRLWEISEALTGVQSEMRV